jgi:hypothetical protein
MGGRYYRGKFVKELKQSLKYCADCSMQWPYYVLQFDHRPEVTKVADVNWIVRHGNMDMLRSEIVKCDLVCANCHATRTWERSIA